MNLQSFIANEREYIVEQLSISLELDELDVKRVIDELLAMPAQEADRRAPSRWSLSRAKKLYLTGLPLRMLSAIWRLPEKELYFLMFPENENDMEF